MATINGTNQSETLNGTAGNDTINGKGGADILNGSSGNDTYIWNIGDGNDTIFDHSGTDDRVSFGSGISVSNAIFTISGRDLLVYIGSEQLTIQDHFRKQGFGVGFANKIEKFAFADGTVLNANADLTLNGTNGDDNIFATSIEIPLDAKLNGHGGNDLLDGTQGNDILTGGIGDDRLQGGMGNDTYHWNLGDGNDTIQDFSGMDQIIFGAGIAPEDVTISQISTFNSPGLSAMTVNIGDSFITIEDAFIAGGNMLPNAVEKLVFADGTERRIDRHFTLHGTEGNDELVTNANSIYESDDTLYGLGGNDRLFGKAGNDTIYGGDGDDDLLGGDGDDILNGGTGLDTANGGAGSDTYEWSIGDGNDIFYTTQFVSGDVNTIVLGPGITASDVSLSIEQKAPPSNPLAVYFLDLYLNIGDEVITLGDHFVGDNSLTDFANIFAKIEFSNGSTMNLDYASIAGVSASVSNLGAQINEDATLTVTQSQLSLSMGGTPVDPSQIIYTLDTAPIKGQLTLHNVEISAGGTFTQANINSGSIRYVPNLNVDTDDSFAFTVSANGMTMPQETFNIDIIPVNDRPNANNDSATLTENTSRVINVLSNDTDPEGSPLTVTIQSGPVHGNVTVNANKTITYTPFANYTGSDSFVYKVNDGGINGTDTATVSLTVNDDGIPESNSPPVANNDSATLTENTSRVINVLSNDTDPEGSPLTVTIQSGPVHGNVTVNANKTITYTPFANYTGSDSFVYKVNDGGINGTDTATVSLTVNSDGIPEPNSPPVANNDSATLTENTSRVINVLSNDTDPEGSPLTVTIQSGPVHGNVTVNANKTITYTPFANYTGSDSFVYKVNDGGINGTDTATVSLTVNDDGISDPPPPTNIAPVANNDTITLIRGSAKTINVLSNDSDADGDSLRVTFNTNPAHATLSMSSNGTLTLIANSQYSGTYSIQYTIDDNNGGTDTGTVTVHAQNPTPVNGSRFDNEITGTNGVDIIYGRAGDDVIAGNDGDDELNGDEGNDIVRGGSGDDFIKGGSGDDRLLGQAGDDNIRGDSGDDTIIGNGGNDVLRGGSGDDFIKGGGGDDKIVGQSGNDTLKGGGRDDLIKGNGGEDTLIGQAGDDTLKGGGSHDTLKGGGGNDTILGQTGNDTLLGQAGNDTLKGGGGDDVLKGNGGNDKLIGQAGADQLYGGAGADTFVFDTSNLRNNGKDTVMDFKRGQGDKLDISSILQGYDSNDDVITDFVSINQAGRNSEIFINRDGNGNDFVKIATLLNVSGLSNEQALENQGILITE